MRGDPYWTTGRFGRCYRCNQELKGMKIFFYPRDSKAYCTKCGEQESRDFSAMAWDEEQYNQGRGC